jgi:hypothetical protein
MLVSFEDPNARNPYAAIDVAVRSVRVAYRGVPFALFEGTLWNNACCEHEGPAPPSQSSKARFISVFSFRQAPTETDPAIRRGATYEETV